MLFYLYNHPILHLYPFIHAIGIFDLFKDTYIMECQAYMNNNPSNTITKSQVAELTAKPYMKARTSGKLTSAFKKTGIHLYNSTLISDSQVAPAIIYPVGQEEALADPNPQESHHGDNQDEQEDRADDQNEDNRPPSLSETSITPATPAAFFSWKDQYLKWLPIENKRKIVTHTLTSDRLKSQ